MVGVSFEVESGGLGGGYIERGFAGELPGEASYLRLILRISSSS